MNIIDTAGYWLQAMSSALHCFISMSASPAPLIFKDRTVIDVETVKLATIVLKLTPELYPFLKRDELDAVIVLRNGLSALEADDAVEIIQHSISEQQKSALLH